MRADFAEKKRKARARFFESLRPLQQSAVAVGGLWIASRSPPPSRIASRPEARKSAGPGYPYPLPGSAAAQDGSNGFF